VHAHKGRSVTHAHDDHIIVTPEARAAAAEAGLPFVRGGLVEHGGAAHPMLESKFYPWGPTHKDMMRASPMREHLVAFTMQGEDLPQSSNRIDLDPEVRDVRGLPVARTTYHPHRHELAASAFHAPRLEAILITHCHFDHVGAVKAVHDATGAPVWCPAIETGMLEHISSRLFPGIGPFEGYVADHTLAGGEALELAGLTFDVRFTPGHSPGHLTYAVRGEGALLSGDVLFAGSVGRTDLPGGDWPTLLSSIDSLLSEFSPETRVYPGHMGETTLGHERATNPFLRELASHS
jgi:glyoxylase-like metal-dependent hydrolase (beta-lactamase superfamily II)